MNACGVRDGGRRPGPDHHPLLRVAIAGTLILLLAAFGLTVLIAQAPPSTLNEVIEQLRAGRVTDSTLHNESLVAHTTSGATLTVGGVTADRLSEALSDGPVPVPTVVSGGGAHWTTRVGMAVTAAGPLLLILGVIYAAMRRFGPGMRRR